MNLPSIKVQLKSLLDKGLGETLTILSLIIKKDIPVYNQLIQFRGSKTRMGRQLYNRYIDINQYNIEMNRITAGVLNYIDEIVESDINLKSLGNDNKLPFVTKIEPNSIGLLLGDFDIELEKVINLITKGRIIRAIGFGRQYKVESSSIPIMEKYYEEIENRISKNINGKSFHYRRITIQKLEERFKDHIKECFRKAKNTSNTLGIAFRENLYLSLRYLIIDNKKMILNLYTRGEVGIQNNQMIFHTEDKEIIEYFIIHFDDAWNNESYKGNVIDNEEDFNRLIPVNDETYESLSRIKRNVKEIYNDSIATIHANSYLANAVKKTEHLRFNYLVINHTKKNFELENAFKWYMDNLDENCSYQTLSFIEFWKNIVDEGSFIRKNKLALETRARIERIFVVDNYSMLENKYIEKCKFIIRENFELACDHPNYQFKIYFTEKYQWCLKEYRNCSIWQNENEIVTFLSDYKKDKTLIYFIDINDDISKNRKKFIKTQDSMRHVNEGIKRQYRKLAKDKVLFLEKCGVDIKKYVSLLDKYFG